MNLREEFAQEICCLYPRDCADCKKGKGCPDEWPDIKERVDHLIDRACKEIGGIVNPYTHTTASCKACVYEEIRRSILEAFRGGKK